MWGSPSCYTHSCRRTPSLHASIVPYPFLFPLYPSTFLPFSPISSPAYPPTHPLWHLWPCSLLTQQQDHMMVVKIAPFIRV